MLNCSFLFTEYDSLLQQLSKQCGEFFTVGVYTTTFVICATGIFFHTSCVMCG